MELDLKGKNVVLRKKDGYVRYGLLLEITERFVVLKYKDGKEEIIGFEAVDSIRENSGVIQ
jgi:hypothetical protein